MFALADDLILEGETGAGMAADHTHQLRQVPGSLL